MRVVGVICSGFRGFVCPAYQAFAATLVVNVSADGAGKAPMGYLRVGVFNSPKTWLEDGAQFIGKEESMPAALKRKYVFEGLPAGRYAVAAYIDENDNRKTDTNLLGIPTEWVGFSGNPNYSFGPPDFEDALIELGEDENRNH